MIENFSKSIVMFLLKWLTKVYLWLHKPYVIVISGTTGRFWAKEKVVEVLKERNFNVRANKKNFNAEVGLPLSILNIPSGERSFSKWMKVIWKAVKLLVESFKKSNREWASEYLVLEMAIDMPEDMGYLLSIVKPNFVILTTITMAYQENFENLDEIAKEYQALVKTIPWNGALVLNNDDERVRDLEQYYEGKVITYGFKDGSQFRAFNVKKIEDGQQFKIEIQRKEKEIESAKINRFGRHHIYAELIKEVIKENFKERQQEFFGKILDMTSER